MTTWYSSDLGWTAGQDISDEFASLVGALRPGDTLVLEDMFRISGSNHQLPDDFTLTATKGGGFDIIDADTNSNPLLRLGDGNTLDNVTISTVSSTPDTGYSGNDAKSGVDYVPGAVIAAFDVDDLTIVDSAFEGNVAMHFDLRFVDNVTVKSSTFDGGYYQMRWIGEASNYSVEGSVFQNALGDGIKTVKGNGAISNITVKDSYFLNNERDGIDTTGGFKDSVISNTVFVGGGIDIKTGIDGPEDLAYAPLNTNIRIENSEFIDTKNGIVTTMLDKAGLMTLDNVDEVMPSYITVTDTIFEMTNDSQGGQRAFFVKDGHNITWDNIQLLGGVTELRLLNAEAPDGWSAYNVGGTNVTTGPSRGEPEYSFDAVPVDKALEGEQTEDKE
ncbi:MAG: right-handed parallel beta-helix repeat-containing protein [Pseudomonadota bacterium]